MILTEETIKSTLSNILLGNMLCESMEDRKIINYLYEELMLEKLLIGEPVSVEELRKILRNKIVRFEFIKLNNEKRPAKGTTMMKYIPIKDHPKGIRPSSKKVATFYDLDKDAWRSVSKRSKEIVLKKDEEGKPVMIVKDKDIKQGEFYNYTTNKGIKTYVKILRKMDDGNYQVSSPLYKTTFAVSPKKLGDQITSNDVKTKFKKQMKLSTGDYYTYKSKTGEETYVKVEKKLDDGFISVSSPISKTTFAISPEKLGEKISQGEAENMTKSQKEETPE